MSDLGRKRGYWGIGIYQPKFSENVGTLWRTAQSFGVDFLFTIGARYSRQPSDTTNAAKHVPVFHFKDFDGFMLTMPHNASIVGVELSSQAIPLARFTHPQRAIYLLGAEDSGLPVDEVISQCNHVVQVEGSLCLNVAVTGAIVAHHRLISSRPSAQTAAGNGRTIHPLPLAVEQ